MVNEIVREATPDQTALVPTELIETALRTCKPRKACGWDQVFYEHYQYGGKLVLDTLSLLFTAMLRQGYIPTEMKNGIIVTIHKGSNKRKDDPNNYRAITLMPTILKVYELVLLSRSKTTILTSISNQQGGFQEGLGCLMTSFFLKEAILYAKENKSQVFVSFLDAKQAFDRVWHNGLLYKLYNTGIDSTTFLSFVNMYTDMKSSVRNGNALTEWFNVLQGTRQGSKSSPLLYLLFVDGLIKLLEQSGYGICIYDLNACSPTVADDMVIVSFSRFGLQRMIDICHRYSKSWRYEYNPSKCSVIIFNGSTNINADRFVWKLDETALKVTDKYKHLGVICDRYYTMNPAIQDACAKLRSTYFSVLNSGLHPKELNPITLVTIYNSVVIPKALYGCELWNFVSQSSLLQLERSHRMCAKSMQHLPLSTSTDICLRALGLFSIETEIDIKKLQFFGQLCNLPNQYVSKQFFIHRLIRFINDDSQVQGFIPDTYRLLRKYNLYGNVLSFIQSGSFPTKYSWNLSVKRAVYGAQNIERNTRFDRLMYRELHSSIFSHRGPCRIWKLSQKYPFLKLKCEIVIRAFGNIFSFNRIERCHKCELIVEHKVLHLLNHCISNNKIRDSLWRDTLYILGEEAFLNFITGSPCLQFCELFSGLYIYNVNDNDDAIMKFIIGHLYMLLS